MALAVWLRQRKRLAMRPRLSQCGDSLFRDGAFLRKEARTGRQMDQDLHGKMVADVYLHCFHITGRW
jgi:hypothetical protein